MIGACIITYNSDISILKKGIDSLKNQVEKIIIVDNGSKNKDILSNFCGDKNFLELILLNENMGIAYATNVALKRFLDLGYNYVLTSDQDSSYPSDYIENFIKNKSSLCDDRIVAYAPIFFDENENDYAKIVVKSKMFVKSVKAENSFTDIFQAIASGLIIDLSQLSEIGFMNEDLFIDWVDLEWCWRVKYYGKRIVCCKNMVIRHKLGDYAKKVGYRSVSLRSYVRNYYITRNAFYLALYTKYLKKIAKFILFFKSFRYIFGYTLLSEQHFMNLKYTLKGFWDGITKKLGRIEDK